MQKYTAIANTNEFGLICGKQYIVVNSGVGLVDVYDAHENYLKSCRIDSFVNFQIKQ